MMSKEAMQMALEALESDPVSHAGLVNRKQAINALRQALEEEREPLCWTVSTGWVYANDTSQVGTSKEVNWTPIYTEPPKQWVGLTVLEVYECWKTGDVVAAVEAKLKEKNKW